VIDYLRYGGRLTLDGICDVLIRVESNRGVELLVDNLERQNIWHLRSTHSICNIYRIKLEIALVA